MPQAMRNFFMLRSGAVKYRKLGNSELLVSEIAFGSWLTFSEGAHDAALPALPYHRSLTRDALPLERRMEPLLTTLMVAEIPIMALSLCASSAASP